MTRSHTKRSRGFTLIEMLIVISLITILVSVALPAYNQSIWRARESVLKQNLFSLRSVISQYTLDKQKAPQSLEDLVTAGYFKQIPTDPMTGRNDSWTVEEETDTIMTVDPARARNLRCTQWFVRHRQRRHRLQHLVTGT